MGLFLYISIEYLNKHFRDTREIHRQSDKEDLVDLDANNSGRIVVDPLNPIYLQ